MHPGDLVKQKPNMLGCVFQSARVEANGRAPYLRIAMLGPGLNEPGLIVASLAGGEAGNEDFALFVVHATVIGWSYERFMEPL